MKVWIVTAHHSDADGDKTIIAGVFDNFDQAKELVDDLYMEQEIIYDETYDSGCNCLNHNNGYAELHHMSYWDDTIIEAKYYELNQITNEEL